MNSLKIRKIIGTDQLVQERKDHKNWPTCRRNEGTSQLAQEENIRTGQLAEE